MAVRARDERRAPQRGDRRVPVRRRPAVLVPGGQHPAPGRARRHRARDRRRHRRASSSGSPPACRSPRETVAAAARATEPERHAIEVRLAAEDPARDFAPAPGRIGRWVHAERTGRPRRHRGRKPGERVPPDYDPMIAKLIVVDRDRDAAIDRLRRALDEWRGHRDPDDAAVPSVRGCATRRSAPGRLSTDWVADHWDDVMAGERGRAAGGRPRGSRRRSPGRVQRAAAWSRSRAQRPPRRWSVRSRPAARR